jgi:hypothetical protein
VRMTTRGRTGTAVFMALQVRCQRRHSGLGSDDHHAWRFTWRVPAVSENTMLNTDAGLVEYLDAFS